MKAKTISKRVLSVVLCTVMLFSCWVFTAPQADAATAGKYTWRIRMTSSNNTGGWDGSSLTVYGKKTNGTGSEETIWGGSRYDFNWKNETRYPTGDNTTDQFPTKVTYFYDFGGGWTHREMKGNIYLDLYYSGEWHEIGSLYCHSYEWGENKGTKTLTVDASKYPKATSTSISGSNTLEISKENKTVSNTYSAGTVKDQYGVNWYQDATLSAALPSDTTGLSFANNKLSATAAANRSIDYTVSVTATCGSATASIDCDIKTFDYKVTFYDEDGKKVLKAEQTVDYGKSATAPSNPTKPADNQMSYNWGGWTGDGYTSIKSGAQTKKVIASYKNGDDHNYVINYYNGDNKVLDTDTIHYNQTLSVPTNASKASTAQYSYTFVGWKEGTTSTSSPTAAKTDPGVVSINNDMGPGDIGLDKDHKTKNYAAYFRQTVNTYTITYKDADGNVLRTVPNKDYGTVPSSLTGNEAAPAFVEKEANNSYHYNPSWTNEGGKTLDDPIEGNIIFTIAYTEEEHKLSGEGTVTKESTCVEKGTKVFKCTVCSHDVEKEIDINPLGHTTEIAYGEKPGDDAVGKVYFYCKNGCGKYFPAIDNGTKFEANLAVPCATASEAQNDKNAAKVPFPTFNTYTDEDIGGYQYSHRGASLKLSNEADRGLNTIQKMRFSGSVMVPVGMETTIDPANYTKYQAKQYDSIPDDSVIDFGFVYTQHRCLLYDGDDGSGAYTVDPTKFEMGKDNIYSMSVVHKNENSETFVFGENNWSGVTAHNENNETTLTFNLLINVTQKNWKRNYAARTYIIYKYHGEIYLVYDKMNGGETISDRSVWYVAKAVLAMYDEGEETSPAALNMVNYIKEKIVRDDQKVEKAIYAYADELESTPMDYFSDWWKAYNDRGFPVDETYDPEF